MIRCRLVSLLCLLAVGACGFEAPAPKRLPPAPTPKPPLSTVSATLKIPGEQIVAILNDKTKAQLARVDNALINCLISTCRATLIAMRTGDITGEAAGSGMHLVMPFAFHAHLDLASNLLKTGGDAAAQGVADATTELVFKPDWRLESHTNGRVQLSNAKLQIGPLKLSIADLWNTNEEQLSTPIFHAIDERISDVVNIHRNAEALWRNVHQPISAGKNPEAWLMLAPERLRIAPIHTENGALVVSLAADVRARVLVGPRPPVPPDIPKLPPPQTLPAPSNSFAVSVPVMLPYDEAARLAMEQLRTKPIHAGTTQILIDRLKILPSRADVIVQARFCTRQSWDVLGLFDSCGEGYLRGAPQYDAKTGKIRVSRVRYDIATYSLFLTAIRGLARDAVAKEIGRHLVFDVSPNIGKIQHELREALSKPQGKGVLISGRIDSFGDPVLRWTTDGFIALFTAKGSLSAQLSPKAM